MGPRQCTRADHTMQLTTLELAAPGPDPVRTFQATHFARLQWRATAFHEVLGRCEHELVHAVTAARTRLRGATPNAVEIARTTS